MPEALRIVQVLPSLTVGGAETFVVQLAEEQLRQGHDVHLVCVSGGGPLESRLSPALRSRLHITGKRSRYDATVLPRLVALLRRLRPDVVHTHLFTAQSWGTVAARMARVPVVVHTEHACHPDEERLVPFVRRRLARLLDRVIACSSAVDEDVARNRFAPPEKRRLVENGIPLDGRPRATLDGDPLRVGCVGRLVPIKGHTFLVKAMGLLRDRGVPVVLKLMGDGPLRDELAAEIRALGLEDRVTLVGEVSDVARRLAEVDLFVLPSLSEGLPMTLLEASAAGLPLLVTSGGGGGLLIEAGAGGWVVPVSDPAALADRIADYAAMDLDDRRSLGQRSLALVTERYGLPGVARRLEAIYREVLAG